MFRKLLIPLDRSPLAEQAIGQAAAIARAAHAAIDVVLVHQPAAFAGFNDAPWNDDESKYEQKYVEAVAAELSSGAGVPVTHGVVGGEAVDMICKRAWDVDADLTVMTSHGRTGLSRAWLGSADHARRPGCCSCTRVSAYAYRHSSGRIAGRWVRSGGDPLVPASHGDPTQSR